MPWIFAQSHGDQFQPAWYDEWWNGGFHSHGGSPAMDGMENPKSNHIKHLHGWDFHGGNPSQETSINALGKAHQILLTPFQWFQDFKCFPKKKTTVGSAWEVEIFELPSGNLLHSYWKLPFIVNFYPLKMVIFHSYVVWASPGIFFSDFLFFFRIRGLYSKTHKARSSNHAERVRAPTFFQHGKVAILWSRLCCDARYVVVRFQLWFCLKLQYIVWCGSTQDHASSRTLRPRQIS